MSSTDKIRQFLTRNWISIFGVLIGVVGLGFSFYFYRLSVAERAPVLVVDPVRTKIIDSQSFPNSALKVLRNDNSPVASDITAIRFYFWNDGTASVKQENVLQPLLLSLTDQGAEILDYKMLKASRPDVVLPNLSRDEKDPGKRLLLTFKILEANDGFTGQIIFSGNSSADLHFSGVIEGVKDVKTNVTLSKAQFWKTLGLLGLIIIAFIAVAVGVIVLIDKAMDLVFGGDRSRSTSRLNKLKLFAARSFIVIFALFLLAFLIYGFIVMPIQLAREASRTGITDVIPSGIRP